LAVALVFYGALFVFFRLMRERIAFPAPKVSYAFEAANGFVKLKTSLGVQIAAVWLPNPSAKYTLLYSHGNGEDLGEIMPVLKAFQKMGLSVLGYEYPGYGHSEGKPSAPGLYAAADAAWAFLTKEEKIAPECIAVMGYSMGSAAACYLAGAYRPRALVVAAGFASAIESIFPVNIFPWESFLNNRHNIAAAGCPVYLLHGTRDRVVPFRNGKALYALARGPKFFAVVPDAGHYTLGTLSPKAYWFGIPRFIETLNPAQLIK